MLIYISIGVLAFLAGVVFGGVVLILFLRGSGGPALRSRRKSTPLNRFNFDKQKKYEKEGRKFPFSY